MCLRIDMDDENLNLVPFRFESYGSITSRSLNLYCIAAGIHP